MRNSARAPASVDNRSPLVSGRLRVAATHSPEPGLNIQTCPVTSEMRPTRPGGSMVFGESTAALVGVAGTIAAAMNSTKLQTRW